MKNFIADLNKKSSENFLEVITKTNHPLVKKIISIDESFSQLEGVSFNQLLTPFFRVRAHSSYIAAARTGLGGQLPEAYILLRNVLEQALYAWFIKENVDLEEVWIKRMDGESQKREVKNKFKIQTMLNQLGKSDQKLASIISSLYESFIDYGAHPNIFGVATESSILRADDQTSIDIPYLFGDDLYFQMFLKDLSRAGVGALMLFRAIDSNAFSKKVPENIIEDISKDL